MYETREEIAKFRAAVESGDVMPRLRDIAEELVSLHRELALLLANEKEGRVKSWFAAAGEQSTMQGRDRIADLNTIDLATEICKVKGEIAAFNEERDFLKLLLLQQGGI